MNIIPQCPNCGCTRVQYNYSTSTLMGYTKIIDNGKLESCDPNWHTSYYTCCKCSHKFHISERYGRVEEIKDDGPVPQVPISNIPLNASEGTSTISIKEIPETEIKFKWQIDIEDLQRQMKEVKEALERLEVNMSNGHNNLVETTQM